jgi:hypothetical protein
VSVVVHCQRCGFENPSSITFCAHCGWVLDRPALQAKAQRMQTNFTGPASTSPRIEEFWATGDPAVVYDPAP